MDNNLALWTMCLCQRHLHVLVVTQQLSRSGVYVSVCVHAHAHTSTYGVGTQSQVFPQELSPYFFETESLAGLECSDSARLTG